MRRIATLVSILFVATSAIAGETADLDVLGFSSDGRIFAFEEYGIQDGSGFPYANRYYIDTHDDKFVSGTPIRVRIDDEAASIAQARARSQADGERIVPASQLADNRGNLVGFNAVTEISANGDLMTVNPRPVDPPIDEPMTFILEQLPLAAQPGNCEGLEGMKGFTLVRGEGRVMTEIHKDVSIPKSRSCPTGYRIGGVQTFYPVEGEPVYAVLISVKSFGFEGPDYRWIAVTGKI